VISWCVRDGHHVKDRANSLYIYGLLPNDLTRQFRESIAGASRQIAFFEELPVTVMIQEDIPVT
jgi:hypothetical protein